MSLLKHIYTSILSCACFSMCIPCSIAFSPFDSNLAAVMGMPVIRSEPSDLSDGSDLSSLSHLFFYCFFHYFYTIFHHFMHCVFLLKLSSLLPLKNHKKIFFYFLLLFLLFIQLLFSPYRFIIIHTFMHYFCSLAFYIMFIIIFSVYLGFNVILCILFLVIYFFM